MRGYVWGAGMKGWFKGEWLVWSEELVRSMGVGLVWGTEGSLWQPHQG